MKIKIWLKILLLLTQAPLFASAQDYNDIENSLTYYLAIEGEIPERYNILDRLKKHNIPAVSVAIILNNEITWAKSWGIKDVSTDEPVNTETLFQAASVSKPLSAIAAMRLVEEGLLSLDDPINNYLKRWKIPENDFTKITPVTLRMILTHTAGLSITGFPGYKHNQELPSITNILNGVSPANTNAVIVDQEPDTEWRYSGGGYTIAQLAMEDVTGLSYPEIMKKYVLDPFGMENSTYEINLTNNVIKKIAYAHDSNGDVFGSNKDGKYHLYPEMAAASLWTNPTDLAKAAIHTNYIYAQSSNSILNKTSSKELFKIHKGDWGIGYDINHYNNGAISFSHTGSNEGYKANFIAYTDGRGIFMMTNGDNGTRIMNEIFYGISNTLKWPENPVEVRKVTPIPSNIMNDYRGTFILDENEKENVASLLNTIDLTIHTTNEEMLITYGDFIKSMKLYHDQKQEKDDIYFVLSGHEFSLNEDENGLKTVTFYGRKYIKAK